MLRNLRTCLGCLVGCVFALMMGSRPAAAQEPVPHLALVVGNSVYADAPLPTAANDAGLVARALSQTGFTVTAAGDVDRIRLDAVFETFAAQVKAAGPEAVVFVYLAGYGVQFSGDIYLVPIGAKVARDVDVPGEAVSASAFRRQIEALPAKASIFVHDLARDNPFARDGTRLAGGLPLIQPAAGTLIAFNAAPGTIAAPDVAPYGFYARALSEMIATRGLGLSTLFERVRLRVSALTAGATMPWASGTIPDGLTLASSRSPLRTSATESRPADGSANDRAYVAAVARDTLDGYLAYLKTYPGDPLAPRIRTVVAVRREASIWNETLRLDTDRAYWTYMRRYPRGPHFPDARRRLLVLHAPLEPPPRFDIVTYTSAALPTPAELLLIERPCVSLDDPGWPPVPVTADMLSSAPPAFYDELPPPPLVPDGVLPIADPIVGVGAESVAISQPHVPSGASIMTYTSFLPAGGWAVESKSGDKTIGRQTMTPGPNADRTIVQTGPEGAVVARTTIVHDKGGTTIIQTGPSGGILTKSVTRADAGGGKITVLTTGGNQMIATVQVDRQGMTSVRRGLADLPPSTCAAGSAQVVIPPDPPAPPPLTMPISSLPASAAGPSSTPGKAATPRSVDAKGLDAKGLDAKGSEPKASGTKTEAETQVSGTGDARPPEPKAPEAAAQEVVSPDSAAHLPAIGPVPPRRAVPAPRPEPARKAGPAKWVVPASHAKGPRVGRR